MKSKFTALFLALALSASAFSGCTSTPAASSDTASSAVIQSSTSSEIATESSEAELTTATEPTGKTTPCRIVQPGTLPPEYDAGIKAINEKLATDGVGIEVEVIRIPWDAYAEKLNLMLTTGEAFELLHIMQDVKNISAIAGMGAILPIEEYLPKYPDLVSKFTELEWKGSLYNGKTYAVPASWRKFDNVMSYITYRQDIADAAGYKEFPTTTANIIDLMEKSQKAIQEENGLKAYSWYHQNQDTAHWLHRSYDTYPFYVENSLGLVISRQDGTIDSFYESEEFKNDANTYFEMYEKGLINPDILNLDSQKKYDDADFGAFLPSQTFSPNQSNNIKKNTGIDSVVNWTRAFPDKPDMLYTYVQNLNAISATSEDPESGLKLLNWMYGKEENHDLFHYGVEGTHYTKLGDDRIEQLKGEDDKVLFTLDTWMTGYVPFMKYGKDSTDQDIDMVTFIADNYVVSPIAGFIFDSTKVQSELTNLQTEIIASIYPIKVGMVSYEENIGPAIEKLKAAGLDKYLEEYRSQFAEYLKANPDVLELAKGNQK